MGCSSFMCKECNKPILSNRFTGQEVELFLLKDGKVEQVMEGQYDSYGRVFTADNKDSVLWDIPWGDVVDLMFDTNKDKDNGIAAVHSKCWAGKVPTTRSASDPNQGWGNDGEYMCNTDDNTEYE